MIIHIDLDTFFVSCKRLLDSILNNKPVLVDNINRRSVVATCSYEGIYSAMPIKIAKLLCPKAIVIQGNNSIYSEFSNHITEIIKTEAPVYEKFSIDELVERTDF